MSDLAASRIRKTVLTFGVFDPLHEGHLNLLKQAKELGDSLLVVVARDSFIRIVKKREPVVGEKDRVEKVRAVGQVNEVLLGDDWPTDDRYGLLRRLEFDVIVLGYDQAPSIAQVTKELQAIGKRDVLVVRLKSFFPDKYKSSYFHNN